MKTEDSDETSISMMSNNQMNKRNDPTFSKMLITENINTDFGSRMDTAGNTVKSIKLTTMFKT